MSLQPEAAAVAPPVARPHVCPRCRRPLIAAELAAAHTAGETTCGRCGGAFQARVFSPPALRSELRRRAEVGPTAGAICALHQGNLASATCARCGAFACGLCLVEIEGTEYCAACFERLRQSGEAPFLVVRYRSLRAAARWAAVLGLLLWPLAFVLGPLAVALAFSAFRQEERLEPGASRLGLWAIALLGVLDLALFVLFVAIFLTAMQAGS